jgi:outer membrane protein OmpA-like peptidoglycan-associated protein
MKKLISLTVAAAALAVGSAVVSAQGHGGGGARDGAYGSRHGGGGRANVPAGGWQRTAAQHNGWHGGNHGHWHGGYGGWRRGWYGGYGPRIGFYGAPSVWIGAPYPYYSPYPVYAPPYPVYADQGPMVYVERPPIRAEPPPPTYAPPPVAAATPQPVQPVPQDDVFERYTLSARELFEFDRAVLRMPQPKLDEIAAVLARNPQINHVQITGYTDRIGTDSYNLKLSQRRADAVKSYLVGKGVAAIRLTAVGRGKANPVVECNQTSRPALIKCLEPNRRVEVEQITVERRIRS